MSYPYEYYSRLQFSDEEIAEKEEELRKEGCLQHESYLDDFLVTKIRFCEGDFKDEVINNVLECKKCGHKVDLVDVLEKESEEYDEM